MNKKFFTLIASALMLVTSVGTANAQLTFDGMETDPLTATRQAKNLYHLYGETSTATGVLTLDDKGYVGFEATAGYTGQLGYALWCISVIDREDQGLGPTYTFTNKGGEGGGGILAVAPEDLNLPLGEEINVLGGDLLRWDFSREYKSKPLETQRPFILYYGDPDKVLTFVLRTDGTVGVKAFDASTIFEFGKTGQEDVIFFTVYKPDFRELTAEEFNTVIYTQKADYIGLIFTPSPTDVSEFQTPIKAENVTSIMGPGAMPAGNWLKFYKNTTDANKWLRVDTAYTGTYGTKFLKFAWGEGPSVATAQKEAIERQYYFKARYYIMNDSLAIDVMQATFPEEGYKGNWYQYYKTVWDGHSTNWKGSPWAADSLHLKLQDLIAGERSILTIGTREVSTRISFGLTGCEAPVINLTSIPEDLYTITDSRGYHLIMPIYTDTIQGSNLAPIWVKLPDNVDPNQIPAYQWVVEKTRNTNLDTSPIKVTNREFHNSLDHYGNRLPIQRLSLQLYLDATSDLYGGKVKAANFEKVPLAQKKDPFLGYKNITQEDSRFNTYVFNYLHGFNDSQFLDVAKIGTDTSLYVAETKTQFEIIPYRGTGDIKYGYYTNKIPNLAQLVKRAYTIRVKDASRLTNSGKMIMVNKEEHRYVVGKNVATADTAVFLLKTNNTKKKGDVTVNYYALVDTGTFGCRFGTPRYDREVIKVGIDDNSLWAYEQVQRETRTSAFAILQWTEPLYRRFDGATYGSREIKEIFGTSANAPQWLKFTKQNNFGNEFLFENSPRGAGSPDPLISGNDYRQDLSAKGAASISFLGLYNINQYPESAAAGYENGKWHGFRYTLYVDTAFVKRKSNGVGTSDAREFTPKPQYMLAVRPEFVKGDTIWTIHKDSTWNSSGESWYYSSDTTMRVMPSYTRAFWIYNAQDSIGRLDANNRDPRRPDYTGKFAYGAEYTTRLAFVDGVHMGDTFYVLRNNPLTSEIDSAYLMSRVHYADKHYLGANTHYKPRWGRDGNPASYLNSNGTYNHYYDTYNGKSMVFQFRLIDPEGVTDPKNEQSRAFLIESRNNEWLDDKGNAIAIEEMGPQYGRWIKVQNGVPVISQLIDIVEAQQNGAEIFNVIAGEEKKAVSNETTPSVGAKVQVIGETGAVTIVGANGKKVVISNILGQTVANTTLTSDNQTIALPKGIVVVAVDGEAVKAVVK